MSNKMTFNGSSEGLFSINFSIIINLKCLELYFNGPIKPVWLWVTSYEDQIKIDDVLLCRYIRRQICNVQSYTKESLTQLSFSSRLALLDTHTHSHTYIHIHVVSSICARVSKIKPSIKVFLCLSLFLGSQSMSMESEWTCVCACVCVCVWERGGCV